MQQILSHTPSFSSERYIEAEVAVPAPKNSLSTGVELRERLLELEDLSAQ